MSEPSARRRRDEGKSNGGGGGPMPYRPRDRLFPRPPHQRLRHRSQGRLGKTVARDIAAGDAGAIVRARVHLPHVDLPLTQRNAQLVIAREYGYAGWQDLTAEVSKRLGKGLEWAATQARRVIHDNDVERLKQLLAEYPALLSWQGDERHGSLLEMATGAYGDAFGAEREHWFTRGACAELLLGRGVVVLPRVAGDSPVTSRWAVALVRAQRPA